MNATDVLLLAVLILSYVLSSVQIATARKPKISANPKIPSIRVPRIKP